MPSCVVDSITDGQVACTAASACAIVTPSFSRAIRCSHDEVVAKTNLSALRPLATGT